MRRADHRRRRRAFLFSQAHLDNPSDGSYTVWPWSVPLNDWRERWIREKRATSQPAAFLGKNVQ